MVDFLPLAGFAISTKNKYLWGAKLEAKFSFPLCKYQFML
jgi:hypothetical protein